MSHPTIPLYTGVVPNRNQSPIDFANNADNWLSYQAPLATDYNDLATYLDNLAADVDADAIAAANSAANAKTSEDNAAASANFKGEWSAQTGAANKPYSVSHKGTTWLLLNNLADVTLSEPGITSDWFDADSTRRITHNRFLHFYRNR